MRAFFAGCLCVGIAYPAFADEYDLSGMMRPGLWETKTQEVAADGETGPVETAQDCVTLEDIQDFSSFASGEEGQNVTVEQFERGDDYVKYRMSFTSDDPDVDMKGALSGDMKFDGQDSYRGNMTFAMNFQGQSFGTRTNIEARRIGECSDDG
jgi:hypothetical protein